ncbi:MAG: DUF4199 domain-containing protein [Saprospiraceae bacterium]|nr:DUF4199 domain-containing protein [Saprospiraceae bacterium]
MKSYIIRYGLYSGCLLIVLGLINWFLIAPQGIKLSEAFGYTSFIVALMAVPLAIKYFREKLNKDQVTFGQGMKIGLGVSFITSFIQGLYSMIFFVLQGDKFLKWYQENMTPEEWEAAQEQLGPMEELIYAPWFQGIVMFVTVFLIGFIISLISSILLKR